MLKINRGEPWVMWPNKLVDNFIDYPSNLIFDYDGNYEFSITFSFETPIVSKSTLFAKLPSYFGIDISENGFTLIYTYENKQTEYLYTSFQWEINKIYTFLLQKIDNQLFVFLNDVLICDICLKSNLSSDELSHIIFGAGNFPKNGFNLNYFSVILYKIIIVKDGVEIARHNFEKIIHNKCFDSTNNCNFIYKI